MSAAESIEPTAVQLKDQRLAAELSASALNLIYFIVFRSLSIHPKFFTLLVLAAFAFNKT